MGDNVGDAPGKMVGAVETTSAGAKVENCDGVKVSGFVGGIVGISVGVNVGKSVGSKPVSLGFLVGVKVAASAGKPAGAKVVGDMDVEVCGGVVGKSCGTILVGAFVGTFAWLGVGTFVGTSVCCDCGAPIVGLSVS